MRYLIISDLHSNLEALDAVFSAATGTYDQILCCGDLVGYGPQPNEVVDRIRKSGAVCVRGNHDKAACGIDDPALFNDYARLAIQWTHSVLSSDHRLFLYNLQQGPEVLERGVFQIVHGSVVDEDEYVYLPEEAYDSLNATLISITFFGHTHIPSLFSLRQSGELVARMADHQELNTDVWFSLEEGSRHLINPGSVGQPRDGNPAAAYAVFDSDAMAVKFRRAQYEVSPVQQKMREAHLPGFLIHRLEFGE